MCVLGKKIFEIMSFYDFFLDEDLPDGNNFSILKNIFGPG